MIVPETTKENGQTASKPTACDSSWGAPGEGHPHLWVGAIRAHICEVFCEPFFVTMSGDSSCTCACVHTHTHGPPYIRTLCQRNYVSHHFWCHLRLICVSFLIMAHSSFQRCPSNQNMGRGARSDRQQGIILRQSPGKPFPLPHLWFSTPIPHPTSPFPTDGFLFGEFVFPEWIHCVPMASDSSLSIKARRNAQICEIDRGSFDSYTEPQHTEIQTPKCHLSASVMCLGCSVLKNSVLSPLLPTAQAPEPKWP